MTKQTCKCLWCHRTISIDNAYCDCSSGRKRHFCSKEECDVYIKTKKPNEASRRETYKLLCDIIHDGEDIINTRLYKEWKVWSAVADDDTIMSYLRENAQYLNSILKSKCQDKSESAKIGYLSAIICNHLSDYKLKKRAEKGVEIAKSKVNEMMSATLAPMPATLVTATAPKTTRRGIADLEDEEF